MEVTRVSSDEVFETPANPNLRDHRFKLRHQLPHLARRKFALPVRIFEPWNKLPPEFVDSASKEIFNPILMVFGTSSLFPNTPRTTKNLFLIFRFFPSYKCRFLVIWRANALFKIMKFSDSCPHCIWYLQYFFGLNVNFYPLGAM